MVVELQKHSRTAAFPHRLYLPWLLILFAIFVFRVTAQLVQKFFAFAFLPPFERWYSGALTYPLLFLSQILVLALMAWVIKGFTKGRLAPWRKMGIYLLGLGSIYFLGMLFRLVAGFTFAVGHPWLGARIPAFFHLILAAFVILVGHFHYRYSSAKKVNKD
jgi:hypothetical protein